MKLFGKSQTRATPTSDLLNVGCGRRFHPAWVNLDIAPASEAVLRYDAREPLPFAEGSFSAVYHSHVLEHLSRDAGGAFMRECFRVLRRGGIVRVAVPDLETIARLYLENLQGALAGDAEAAERYEWMLLELLDQLTRAESGGQMAKHWRRNPMPAADFVLARMGDEARRAIAKAQTRARGEPPRKRESATGEVHKWMYDRYSLGQLLRECGFVEPRVCGALESAIPRFAEFHLDSNERGATRKPDSIFMEATKPTS